MPKIRLKQLLAKRGENGSLYDDLHSLMPGIGFQDAEGSLLFGEESGEGGNRYAVQNGDSVIGWVIGDETAEVAGRLLNRLVADEAVNAQVMDEVLSLYREINLLYKLSEKLAVTLDLAAVMTVLLEEARRIIKATSGAVILATDPEEPFSRCISFGSELSCESAYLQSAGLIKQLIYAAKGEIVNDVASDPRRGASDGSYNSLICAPLTTNHKLSGILVLVSSEATLYTAADLKLIIALASQALPSIENAILHERTLREAQEREAQLQRRIDELRIELDEARQVQKVAELVETEYFQQLRKQSSDLRKIIEGDV